MFLFLDNNIISFKSRQIIGTFGVVQWVIRSLFKEWLA